MVRRSASIALRVAAVALGLLVVVGAFFAWRISSGGPVSVGFLNSRIEAMINSSLKSAQVRIGDSVIEWSKDNKFAHLQFIDIEALDPSGNVIARVPRANVSLAGPALLKGEAVPTRVEVIGANAMIVRRADGGMQLGFQFGDKKTGAGEKPDAASEGMTKAILEAMLNPKASDTFTRYLNRVAITNAKVTLFDEGTRSYWSAEKASLTFDRKGGGVVAAIETPIDVAEVIKHLRIRLRHQLRGALAQRARFIERAILIIGPAQTIDHRVIALTVIEAAPQQAIALFQTFRTLDQRVAECIEAQHRVWLFGEELTRRLHAIAPTGLVVHQDRDVEQARIDALIEFECCAHVGCCGCVFAVEAMRISAPAENGGAILRLVRHGQRAIVGGDRFAILAVVPPQVQAGLGVGAQFGVQVMQPQCRGESAAARRRQYHRAACNAARACDAWGLWRQVRGPAECVSAAPR